jgi:hypothetical protein
MGSFGKPPFQWTLAMLVQIVGLWLWDNKFTIGVSLSVGVALGHSLRP